MNKLTTNTTKTNVLQLALILLKGTTLLLETHGNFEFRSQRIQKIEVHNK